MEINTEQGDTVKVTRKRDVERFSLRVQLDRGDSRYSSTVKLWRLIEKEEYTDDVTLGRQDLTKQLVRDAFSEWEEMYDDDYDRIASIAIITEQCLWRTLNDDKPEWPDED